MPDSEQVRLIFKETYLFYTKWNSISNSNWDKLMQEARELNKKYPFALCRQILIELIEVIEGKFKEKEG